MKVHELKSILSHKYFRYAIVVLILASILPYLLSLQNGFVSDDVGGIMKNSDIGNFSSILASPLNFVQPLIYFVTYKLFGLSPLFFHLPNLLFHVGSVLMLFLAVSLLVGLEIGFFSTLLFAVHPLASEAVVWISAGSYTRYTFFVLAGLASYLISMSNISKPKKKFWYSLSFLMFLFGLFSSEKALVFPLILFVYHLADRSVKTHLKNLVPFFLGAFIFIIPFFFHIGSRITDTKLEYGALTQIISNPLVQIPVAVSTYLKLFIWPDKLDFFHADLFISPLTYIVFALYVAGLILAWLRNRQIFFWLSFFIIALSPTLLPLRIASTVAERYVYLGMTGIIVTFVILLFTFAKKGKITPYIIGVLFVLTVVLSIRTVVRTFDWKSDDALTLAGNRTSPNTLNNHLNLGNLYAKQGRWTDAVRELKMTLVIEPNYAKGYNNLGYVYAQMGRFSDAMTAYQKGLRINPTMWETHDNLAGLYTAVKQYDLALREELLAIKYSNNNIDLYTHLGIIYVQMGDKVKARQAFEMVLKFDPKNQEAQEMLLDL